MEAQTLHSVALTLKLSQHFIHICKENKSLYSEVIDLDQLEKSRVFDEMVRNSSQLFRSRDFTMVVNVWWSLQLKVDDLLLVDTMGCAGCNQIID